MITPVDILSSLLLWLVMLGVVQTANRDLPQREKRLLGLVVLLRALSTLALVVALFTVFGGQSDSLAYHRTGLLIASTLETDSFTWLRQVTLLIMQVETARMPFTVVGIGSATGTMMGLTGLLHWVLGPGLLTVSSAYAALAMVGTVLLYRTARRWFSHVSPGYVAAATMMVPTVLFWTGGILKESLTLCGLGLALWGFNGVVSRKRPLAAAQALAAGVILIYLSKPFFLVALVAAMTAWLVGSLARRTGVRFSSLQLVLLSGASVGAVFALGEISGQFSVNTLVEETARLQDIGRTHSRGSTIVIVDSSTRSLAGQLAYSPLALFTALYRPLLVEARTAPMAVNALESTAFAVFTFAAIRAATLRGTLNRIASSPWLQFCVIFVLLSAVGIGLATHNLGTLSRYRVPFVPIWMMSLAVIHASGGLVGVKATDTQSRRGRRPGGAVRRPMLQPLAKVD
jgi:hypothetical protein